MPITWDAEPVQFDGEAAEWEDKPPGTRRAGVPWWIRGTKPKGVTK
jgi:hypothetical protein